MTHVTRVPAGELPEALTVVRAVDHDAEVDRLLAVLRGERGDPLLDRHDDMIEDWLLVRLERHGLLREGLSADDARERLDA